MTPLPSSRRDFVRSVVRRLMLGALGAGGAALALRGRICLTPGGCRSCTVYERCRLPARERRS